jgi:hypothetical protein
MSYIRNVSINNATEQDTLSILRQSLPFVSSDVNFIIDNLLKEILTLINMSCLKEALEKMVVIQ